MFSDIHCGGDLEEGFFLLLRTVNCRTHFGYTEHIRYTVVADSVAASEVLVGVVIRHTPTDCTARSGIAVGGVKHSCVTESVFRSYALFVKTLCWVHMTVMLRNKIGSGQAFCNKGGGQKVYKTARMNKVIHCVNVLKQMAERYISDAACLTGVVKFPCNSVCFGVELVAVKPFVYADAPKNNTRVVSVTGYHFTNILFCKFSPFALSKILPRGHFGEHKESDFVTAVKEMYTVGVMGGSYKVNTQLIFK